MKNVFTASSACIYDKLCMYTRHRLNTACTMLSNIDHTQAENKQHFVAWPGTRLNKDMIWQYQPQNSR